MCLFGSVPADSDTEEEIPPAPEQRVDKRVLGPDGDVLPADAGGSSGSGSHGRESARVPDIFVGSRDVEALADNQAARRDPAPPGGGQSDDQSDRLQGDAVDRVYASRGDDRLSPRPPAPPSVVRGGRGNDVSQPTSSGGHDDTDEVVDWDPAPPSDHGNVVEEAVLDPAPPGSQCE